MSGKLRFAGIIEGPKVRHVAMAYPGASRVRWPLHEMGAWRLDGSPEAELRAALPGITCRRCAQLARAWLDGSEGQGSGSIGESGIGK